MKLIHSRIETISIRLSLYSIRVNRLQDNFSTAKTNSLIESMLLFHHSWLRYSSDIEILPCIQLQESSTLTIKETQLSMSTLIMWQNTISLLKTYLSSRRAWYRSGNLSLLSEMIHLRLQLDLMKYHISLLETNWWSWERECWRLKRLERVLEWSLISLTKTS